MNQVRHPGVHVDRPAVEAHAADETGPRADLETLRRRLEGS